MADRPGTREDGGHGGARQHRRSWRRRGEFVGAHHDRGDRQRGTDQSRQIESARQRGSRFRTADDARRHQPDDADRDVDQEDGAPARMGDDETTDDRREDRCHECGPGQIGDGPDDLGSVDGTQHREPADRDHHRPAGSLYDAHRDEPAQTAGKCAAQRTECEHRHRAEEHRPHAPALRRPATHRDDHGERHQVGGHHTGRVEGRHAEVVGDGRQSRDDDGRVQDLHEHRRRPE